MILIFKTACLFIAASRSFTLIGLRAYFNETGSSSILVCDPFTPELLRQQESVERSDAFNCSSVLVQFQSPGYRDESITHMGMA